MSVDNKNLSWKQQVDKFASRLNYCFIFKSEQSLNTFMEYMIELNRLEVGVADTFRGIFNITNGDFAIAPHYEWGTPSSCTWQVVGYFKRNGWKIVDFDNILYENMVSDLGEIASNISNINDLFS